MWTSCVVETSSHELTAEPFSLLANDQLNMRIRVLSESELLISVRHIGADNEAHIQKVHTAHQVIRMLLISLNVASLGYFYWKNAPWLHPILITSEDLAETNQANSALLAIPVHSFEKKSQITKLDAQNAILIFGILAKERTFDLDEEYTKGILLLRMQFCDVEFRREAFLCFYRALEYFIASRVLKVKKFTNELKDMQRGLASVGLKNIILDEFKEIYTIRSSQAAHSQITPRKITFEEVMKAKVFLDFVIHKTFVTQATEILRSNNKNT